MSIKVQARIDDELAARLDAEVERLQTQHPAAEVSRSTVVRAALTEYLKKEESQVKMSLETARATAHMGANDDEYPGTRYIIDCGGTDEERYTVKMNPFTLEKGQKVIDVVKRGDGVGRWNA